MKMLSPISFSIPKDKIMSYVPVKTKLLSSIIPKKLETYIYDDEEDYYNEYRKSLFAITMKKDGWDCMRHYEILANGCIPVFLNIEDCPKNTLTLFPKDLILYGNRMYEIFNKKGISNLSLNDIDEYFLLVSKLLCYTRINLTTCKTAEYILKKIGLATSNIKILYLSGDLKPDYLRCLTLHGFKVLLGRGCHDYPKIDHLYRSNSIDYKSLYGKGMTYSSLLDNSLHNYEMDDNVKELISSRYFDLVIYGSYHRNVPSVHTELVNLFYRPNEIVLLCGEDIHDCNYNVFVDFGYNVFVRELD